MSSTQLVTDENGDQVARFIFGAWGEELYASESVPGVLENRFVGGLGCRKDAATGLIYMRHRWYDPALQRFISRDPIGLRGGANLYVYAAGNPVSNVDASGLLPVGDIIQVIAPVLEHIPIPVEDARVTEGQHSNASTYYGDDGKVHILVNPKFCKTATLNDYANLYGHEYTHAVQQALEGVVGKEMASKVTKELQAALVQSAIGTVLKPSNEVLQEQNAKMYDAIQNTLEFHDPGYLKVYIQDQMDQKDLKFQVR